MVPAFGIGSMANSGLLTENLIAARILAVFVLGNIRQPPVEPVLTHDEPLKPLRLSLKNEKQAPWSMLEESPPARRSV
jgi:hypothetical protein